MLVIIMIFICTHTSHIFSCHTLPTCCEEKEPKDEQLCIEVHTINNNICDANPLDNSSNKAQLNQVLPCITDPHNYLLMTLDGKLL